MIEFIPVTMPADLAGQKNGRLGPCSYVPVNFPGVGHLSLHPLAARAWEAMVIAYVADPLTDDIRFKLSTTGTYRTYDAQVTVFLQRYTDSYLPIRNVLTSQRTWQGKTWYLRRNMSPVAVPGTSNHGWALANDMAICSTVWDAVAQRFITKIISITTDPTTWAWIQANAVSFGWSWEGAKPGTKGWEPWHIRYVAGDDVPERVLAIEAWIAAEKAK